MKYKCLKNSVYCSFFITSILRLCNTLYYRIPSSLTNPKYKNKQHNFRDHHIPISKIDPIILKQIVN